MIRRPAYVPSIAERLALESCVTAAPVPSQFAPGATALQLKLCCPACRAPQLDAAFRGETIAKCPCGLRIVVESGSVFIWRDRLPKNALRESVTRDPEARP